MTNEENNQFKDLKKEVKKLNAMIERRDKKIEDNIRNESYLKSAITELTDSNMKLDSKIKVIIRNIDSEMIT